MNPQQTMVNSMGAIPVYQPNMPPPLPNTGGYVPGAVVPPPAYNPNMPPQNIPNCPFGLEYLTQINTLKFVQIVRNSRFEANHHNQNAMTDHNTMANNVNFAVKNVLDQDIFFSRPDEGCKTENLLVFDTLERVILMTDAPTVCGKGFCGCGDIEIDVRTASEQFLGRLVLSRSMASMNLNVYNAKSELMYRISKSHVYDSNQYDAQFHIRTKDNTFELGKISKIYTRSGMRVFELNFPIDLEVCSKALLVTSVFHLTYNLREAPQRH